MSVLNKDKILDAAKDYISQKKYDKAIKEFEKVLAVDPADMRIKIRIAELFIKRRQIPEAIKTYREVAESYTHDGFFLKAVTVYKNILRLNPSLLDVNEALAGLYEKMGIIKDAIQQYSILAAAFEQKGQLQESLRLREKLTELDPNNATYRTRLAESYERENRGEDAIQQYEILVSQYKEKKEDAKKIIELFEKILPHRASNVEMLRELVGIYYKNKEYSVAVKWLESRKQLVADDADLLSNLAEMYGRLNQLETARSKYQDLADLYIAQGQTSKALEAFGEILFLLPEEAENIKTQVEELQPGSFEGLSQRAETKRMRIEEAEKIKEEAEQKKREEVTDKGKPMPKAPAKTAVQHPVEAKAAVLRKDKPAPNVSSNPSPIPPPKSVAKAVSSTPEAISKWIKVAQAALSLAKAYGDTGLNDEAGKEYAHAKEALEKILKTDPNHPQAKSLINQLPK